MPPAPTLTSGSARWALRALTERLEILQVDNARALGWSRQDIAGRLGVTKHRRCAPRSCTTTGSGLTRAPEPDRLSRADQAEDALARAGTR